MARIPFGCLCGFRRDRTAQADVAVRRERPHAGWRGDVHAEVSSRVSGDRPRDGLVPGRGRRDASAPTSELLLASSWLLHSDPVDGYVLHGAWRAPRLRPLQPYNRLEVEQRIAFCVVAGLFLASGLSREYSADLAGGARSSDRGVASAAGLGLHA